MDQQNNPGGGALPPPAAPQPAADPMAELTAAMATLANVSTMQLANNLSKAKAVQKPSPFKGEHGSDARRFLAAFTMWAMAQGTSLNVVDQQGNAVDRRDMEWIRAALSFLQDDASVWAAPAMEEFADGGVPFNDNWQRFRTQFKARFETVDEAVDAKEKLRVLWQDSSTVPEYAALFKEAMARTGYSSADLRDRFYEHLSTRIKDELVHTARPIGTLDELVMVASDLDIRLRQRRAERDRERRRSGVATGTTATQTPLPSNPFISPVTELTAMDVDATHTRDEFLRRMRGKCFGCGSAVHARKDGNHERDQCNYCKHVGHREVVCMEKFMGKPKGQKAAATDQGEEVGTSTPDEGSGEPEGEGLAATTAITLAQLVEQQKALAEQIAALREQDF
jgi:Retrotransposon gag protein